MITYKICWILIEFFCFFLPEGMLDFFELVWMKTESLTSRESQKDIAYTDVLHIHLDE